MKKTVSRDKQELIALIRQKSYREGKFRLASGRESRYYVDLKPTTLHPRGAELIGRLSVREALAHFSVIHAVGGLTLGADPIATAVSLAAWKEGLEWPAFIVRKDAKGHGTQKYVEGTENLHPGAKLLVVEDVATTGASSLAAVARLRDAGYEPVAVLCVVDREEGADAAVAQAGLKLLRLVSRSELSLEQPARGRDNRK